MSATKGMFMDLICSLNYFTISVKSISNALTFRHKSWAPSCEVWLLVRLWLHVPSSHMRDFTDNKAASAKCNVYAYIYYLKLLTPSAIKNAEFTHVCPCCSLIFSSSRHSGRSYRRSYLMVPSFLKPANPEGHAFHFWLHMRIYKVYTVLIPVT